MQAHVESMRAQTPGLLTGESSQLYKPRTSSSTPHHHPARVVQGVCARQGVRAKVCVCVCVCVALCAQYRQPLEHVMCVRNAEICECHSCDSHRRPSRSLRTPTINCHGCRHRASDATQPVRALCGRRLQTTSTSTCKRNFSMSSCESRPAFRRPQLKVEGNS